MGKCEGDHYWYSQICGTGGLETVSFNGNGGIQIVSKTDYENDDAGTNFDNDPSDPGTPVDNDTKNDTENLFNHSPNRFLRDNSMTERERDYEDMATGDEPLLVQDPVPALLLSQSEIHQGRWLHSGHDYTAATNGEVSGEGRPANLPEFIYDGDDETDSFQVRPCLCHPSQFNENYYKDDPEDNSTIFEGKEKVPYLYVCPAEADYCGIPFAREHGNVGCFSISIQQVVARNAWPLILLWYFGLVIICCCTIHGNTSLEYFRACLVKDHNEREIDRLLTPSTELADDGLPGGPRRPESNCNWWRHQRYRFEQNLLVQAQWIFRHEEYARQERRRQAGLPPPQYELKTKRYAVDPEDAQERTEEDDSINEPTCTICFAPLEEGDIVGDLPCHHVFHKDCLKSWCSRKNACPLCSVPIAKRKSESDEISSEIDRRNDQQDATNDRTSTESSATSI